MRFLSGVLFAAFCCLQLANAQEILPERITDWSKAGVQTDIPQYSSIFNILDYGGVADGVTSNNTAYTAALNAIGTGGGVIYFPAGTYFFNDRIGIKDSMILRGDGSSSKLIFNLNGSGKNLIIAGGTESGTDYWLSQGIFKDQQYLISTSANLFAKDEWIRLISNDSSLVNDSWAMKTTGQILQVKRISGDTIFVNSPLRRTYALVESPRVRKMKPVKYSGIENLYLERKDQTSVQTTHIQFFRTVNCWILGVESFKGNFSHVSLEYSSNITVRGNYFSEAFDYGNGGAGYGVCLQYGTGECLLENNVFNTLRHAVLFQAGSNGNVVGYNYSINPYWTGVLLPSNSAGDIVFHGNYPYLNLIEGNVHQNLVIDNTHDINGPYNTIFRNRIQLYGILMNTGAGGSQHFVGNDIPNTGGTLGLYTLTGSDNFQYGNRRKGANNIVPSGTSNLSRTSYYLCGAPAYWNSVAYAWPTIGIPYPYNSGENPAMTRYSGGQKTIYNNASRIRNTANGTTWFRDSDGDTFGDPASSQQACSQPAGYVANNTDCDDSKANINPNTIWFEDKDGDKYSTATTKTSCTRPLSYILATERLSAAIDCNDNDAAIHPGATEICDGKDNNCNSTTDEGLLTTYYRDIDGDTFGDPASSQQACSQPAGYVANNTDCDDSKANINPNTIWYEDKDGDKYSTTTTQTSCTRPLSYILASERLSSAIDCNDNDAAIHPGATEICDGKDNNCNSSTDEGLLTTYYRDSDGDTFGDPASSQQACSQPAGYVANNTDCDDTKANINPNTIWYEDKDGDKYSTATTKTSCTRPLSYILATERLSTAIDCNDNDAAIHPGAMEICDGKDNNCNSATDEGLLTTYYRDSDGDTFGDPSSTQQACSQPAGYVANNTDCDDTNNSIYPGATEIPNDGIDQDCLDGDLISTDIQNRNNFTFSVYPNPSEGQFNISIQVKEAGEYRLTVYALDGQLIQYKILNISTGVQIIPLQIANKGFYLLEISHNDVKYIQKLLIN